MSAASIQRKLNKAYGKVGRKLGFESDVYRVSQSYDNPIDTPNWIYNIKSSFSQDNKFSAPVGSNVWLAWLDATLDNTFDLKVGDIIADRETGRVYYMMDMHPLHPYRALETNTTISLATSTKYNDNGFGWSQSQTVSLNNIPAWVSTTGSRSIDSGFVPARTATVQSSDQYTIQLWMPEGSISNNDQITLRDGTVLTVTSAMWDIRGYKLTAVVNE